MPAWLLADLVAGLHLGIVLFVVGGQLLVMLGAPLGWKWVRNLAFRCVHLAAIVYVAVQGALGRLCPLTTLEDRLREQGRQVGAEGSFIGRLLSDFLYVEVPQEALDRCYIAFALLVLATWVIVRPRRARHRSDALDVAPGE